MVNQKTSEDNEKQLIVRRGRVDSVDIYEIKEQELDILERGSPADIQLNFSIFSLSTAITCIVALATSSFDSRITETVFITVSVAGVLAGLYLLLSWWQVRSSTTDVIARIRKRIQEERHIMPNDKDEPTDRPDDDHMPFG